MLSGVTTWSVNMVQQLSEAGRKSILVKHTCHEDYREIKPTYYSTLPVISCKGDTPFSIQDVDVLPHYLDVYKSLIPATIVPNWSPAIYATCAALSLENASRLRILGYAHSDEPYYYETLCYYESIIHKFIAVSRTISNRLAARIPNRKQDILLHPYPVTVPQILQREYAATGSPLRIVYAGRLDTRQKRVSDLVSLAKELVRRNVNFRLSIYGDGPEEEPLREAITVLDPEARDHIILAGFVKPEDMPDVWQQNDICILVSNFEGTSLTMLEAMANGCVPVTTKVSGTQELIEPGLNGFLVNVGDIKGMSEIIQKLDNSRWKLLLLGNASHRTVLKKNNYSDYLPRFIEVCNTVWLYPDRRWPKNRSIYQTRRVL